jgi:hypothetical protein
MAATIGTITIDIHEAHRETRNEPSRSKTPLKNFVLIVNIGKLNSTRPGSVSSVSMLGSVNFSTKQCFSKLKEH